MPDLPTYGKDYAAGDVGFTTDHNRLAKIIKRGTRSDCHGDFEASHCFMIVGENQIVEAQLGRGVVETKLEHHYENPATDAIRFRRVRGYTEELGEAIAESSRGLVGQPFDEKPILTHLIKQSTIVEKISNALGKSIDAALADMLDGDDALYCSELAVCALREQEELADLEFLQNVRADLSNPNELFYADIWEEG